MLSMRSMVGRLWQYQLERFPLGVISLTTLTATVSSWAISDPVSIGRVVLVYVVTILFMFRLRIYDEFKDFEHDNINYPDRPVQRGLVSKSELYKIALAIVALELSLNFLFNSRQASIFYLLVIGYTVLTRKEFFIRNWLRKHFFLYNFLHYIQLGIFQIFVYISFRPLNQSAVKWHFLLVLSLVLLLEFARKLRPKDNDSADDTYSAKFGHKRASYIYLSIMVLAIFCCAMVIMKIAASIQWLLLPLALFAIAVWSANKYSRDNSRLHSKMVLSVALLFYLACYCSIIFGHFL